MWKNNDYFSSIKNDFLAEEYPAALIYNGISYVVMMVTPQNLDLFGIGFSLSEGIINSYNDILGIDIIFNICGIEIQMDISSRCFEAFKIKKRAMLGRTGCGICGIEQLNQAINYNIKPLPFSQKINLKHIDIAIKKLKEYQPIGIKTNCTHAALWIKNTGQLICGYEDVGRHVALDKLLGYIGKIKDKKGAILISSRASYEIIQKSAICCIEIIFALSAATALAVEMAEKYNITLVGFSKPGCYTIYSNPQRLI
ncbi:formate dehydrogenase accessory sulfurtransferase FdhD [Pantoea sp. SoEX]|uniref:formate dehydrogenase accessory sulfurtransferase FdhD n=1 Tax=Pantoea sp. SoEX TaxID=2576763 RepID=UPI0013593943|nr:formate dehydrogenase accessory sulfurtransferase FdhD [Pantoea sp. SoEX]MXP51418.1 formate dehydrogenase accessory sulfurtransferase FdhD [Pantoea sp. SoEX]